MNSSDNQIYGLVLSGGKSTRMGSDKRKLEYHGIAQEEYLFRLLNKLGIKSYISLNSSYSGEEDALPFIKDKDEYRGPFNGMLSAHQKFPDVAWLVLACDLPLMDETALSLLMAERDQNFLATTFASKANPLPEPLAAIWEVQAFKNALDYFKAGNGSCPRKFLMQASVKLVHPKNELCFMNANSLEDYKKAKAILDKNE